MIACLIVESGRARRGYDSDVFDWCEQSQRRVIVRSYRFQSVVTAGQRIGLGGAAPGPAQLEKIAANRPVGVKFCPILKAT